MSRKIFWRLSLFVSIVTCMTAGAFIECAPLVWGPWIIVAGVPFLYIIAVELYDIVGTKVVIMIARGLIDEGFEQEGAAMLLAYKNGMVKRIAKMENESSAQ